MKKNKKIGLKLNKKVISSFRSQKITGGGISFYSGHMTRELLYDCATAFGCGDQSLNDCPIG